MLAAGKLRRQVTLQQPTRTPNGAGGFTKGWTDVETVFAEVIALRGDEALQQQVLNSVQLWKVTIRFRTDIDPTWRLLFEGREMNIRSCEDIDGSREALVMTAQTGVKT